jgi:hypothetical protein
MSAVVDGEMDGDRPDDLVESRQHFRAHDIELKGSIDSGLLFNT